ncbi:hypothetical protein, partial [Escherichia coli]|uniref:hypothetical protein n=1 Tax=Escherichia coli TaxID=562 RepID=UPI0023009C7C
LSLLIHSHINMLGHYTSSLPEDILKGELRSLNFNTNNELTSWRIFYITGPHPPKFSLKNCCG